MDTICPFCSYPCSYPDDPRLRDSFDDLAPVAQLERALASEATGRWFESRGCFEFAPASYSAGRPAIHRQLVGVATTLQTLAAKPGRSHPKGAIATPSAAVG